ncbi:MAG TPA: AsmA family protein [Gallionella sp.]|nr:AsmA family protein [Gallionella sp.]
MNKILKYGLLGIAAMVVVAAAVVAYVAATFNPNDYKAQIIKAVKDSKQRNLRLDGDIKLSFFPNIGASLSKVSLSGFRSNKEFASIQSARVSLALLPLLRRQVVVDEVTVSGLKATLVKHKDGTTNIDDLVGQTGHEPQQQTQRVASGGSVKFDIASVSVEKTDLSYHDEGSGAKYAIKDLNFRTGRIAVGVPSKIDFSANLQSNQPKLDINTQMEATLTLDPEKKKYQLQGLELQASGTALDISNLKVKAGGDVNADMSSDQFAAKRFPLSASGIKGKDNFEVTLDAPSLDLTKDKYSSDSLKLNAKLNGAAGNLAASLAIPGIEGNAQSFRISALTLDLDLKQPEQTFRLKMSSPLSGNIKSGKFDLDNLGIAVTATGDNLPNKSVSSQMKGSVHIDAENKIVQANFAGGLLQSQIKARVGVKGFAKPAINFDVDVDKFDADLYMPKKSAPGSKAESKATEQPLDLSALRALNLDGILRIGSLKVANVKLSQLHLGVEAHNGLVNLSPISANLYQGAMNGSLGINAQHTPGFVIKQKLNGIAVAPLLKDAANLDLAEGKGNIVLNLTTQGNTVSELKKALDGNVSVNLANGAIKGINLTKLVQGLQNLNLNTRTQTLGVDRSEKTEFSQFRASFKVRNGVAHNDDLEVKSTVLRLSGNGDIDIGHDTLNYNAKAAFAKTEQGRTATLPVNVSGPFDALKFKVDYGSLLVDVAKQRIDEKKEKVKEDAKAKLQEELKKGLKDLFK